ncbi:VWA domain-containing protein [Nocardia sp. CDC153]|uniref:VWA domain-containing protein n=1 Tax=Nocardia sp. CDC153 TaxID=3112167 RepID=UPI002DBDF2FB|nr:VWA domain-containing protein [Nocardia sp. CDC153]MEC3952700.1 VWA domain-containing protein [Nocardia sp. CDC153]
MNTAVILDHFRTHGAPLTLSRAGVVAWEDAEFHRTAYAADPERYLLLALVPGVTEHQRARALLQTLLSSRADLPAPTRAVLDKATRALLFGLPPTQVITVLLAARRLRANHKHVTRAILTFVLDHPDAELLIAARRPALVDCFEHALGKNTARGCLRQLEAGDTDSPELRRKLLRFTMNPARAIERVRQLYAPGTHGVPVLTEPVTPLEPAREREPIVTVTNRGDIAATLVHLYRGGSAAELGPVLAAYTEAVTDTLPRLHGHLALVLDTSESMRGYGDREWALLSQAEALRLVLTRLCAQLTVIEVGTGQTSPTDLATGVLDALTAGTTAAGRTETQGGEGRVADTVGGEIAGAADKEVVADVARAAEGLDANGPTGGGLRSGAPDLVVVVTDGYENRLPGDLARVAATLPAIGISTPIVVCQAMFTGSDDRTLRDPAPALPSVGFWHQDDFAALLPWLFARTPAGADWIRTATRRYLADLEGVTG